MVSGLKKPACDLEFLYIYSLLMLLKCAINALTQNISSVFYTNITDVNDKNKFKADVSIHFHRSKAVDVINKTVNNVIE